MSVVLKSRIPQIIGASTARTVAAVQKTAFDIDTGAKMRSRVDTGQMRTAWAVEIQGDFDVLVYNPVEHAVHNEFGTRHMAAQPMLGPAVEEARDPFYKAMTQVYK